MSEVKKPALPLEDIDRLKDQSKRAVEAIAFGAYAEDRAKRARDIRDNACRQLRAEGKTYDQIAEALGYTDREARKALANVAESVVGKEARLRAALSGAFQGAGPALSAVKKPMFNVASSMLKGFGGVTPESATTEGRVARIKLAVVAEELPATMSDL